MRPHVFTPAAIILFSFVIFISCSKSRERIDDPATVVSKLCRIDTLTVNGFVFQQGITHLKVSYNEAGDPIELRELDNLADQILGLDLHFRYDGKRRLTDVLQTDPGMTFVYIWNRYHYPSPTTIIDSIYEYVESSNDVNPISDPGMPVRIQRMQLDEKGRPVKFFNRSSEIGLPADSNTAPPTTSEVAYDRNGDMVVPGLLYDDKVNIYETSQTWQLYFLDYSVHNFTFFNKMYPNETTPVSYNAIGLPTEFIMTPANTIPTSIFSINQFQQITVSYSCELKGPTKSY